MIDEFFLSFNNKENRGEYERNETQLFNLFARIVSLGDIQLI